MYRNNREQATSKYIDYFKINIRQNINIHGLSPGREGKQNRLPHIAARLRMERHDTRTCASFRASRRENKTRRRDFNGTNGHGNFAHRESDEERFEKLGRLLLTNEASLIENRLKLQLRGSQQSFRIRSARVTMWSIPKTISFIAWNANSRSKLNISWKLSIDLRADSH